MSCELAVVSNRPILNRTFEMAFIYGSRDLVPFAIAAVSNQPVPIGLHWNKERNTGPDAINRLCIQLFQSIIENTLSKTTTINACHPLQTFRKPSSFCSIL